MHQLTLWQVNLCAWYAFLIVWGVAALKHKADKTVEPVGNRLLYGTYLAGGLALLFSQSLHFGPLRQRFAPHWAWLELIGVALTYVGAAIAIWARFILADNWSGRITVKVGHQLIRTGPYAYVRHPIYSGILLSGIGTALVVGEWRAVVAIPLIWIAFTLKAKREEAYMTAEFGDGYAQYRQSTGFLLPRL